MTQRNTLFVPAGQALTLIAPADSAGVYYNLDDNTDGVISVAANSTTVIGPYNNNYNFAFECDNGSFSYSLAPSGILSSSDDATIALLAPKASPTFTGTVTVPTPFTIDAVSMTATGTELNYVAGVTSAIQTQLSGEAAVRSAADLVLQSNIDAKKPSIVTSNVGAVGSGVTAVENGDGYSHVTVLTVASVLPAITGGADQAVGALVYTFPAGSIIVKACYMSMGITQSEAHINADTPDVGLGTVIGSGAVAVLDTPTTFENLLTGQTAADCTGTSAVKTVADQIFVIEAADAHTVHFNAAFGWAASGDAAAAITGTIVLEWQFMN
jgi:hypothetical protein